jgi:hypothetical protein
MAQLGNTPVGRTRWTVDQALGWLAYQEQHTTPGWTERCLGITALAFGFTGSGYKPGSHRKYAWAIEAWQQADPGTRHEGQFTNVPRGGILHWKNPKGGPGHTGIALGDGTFFTNDLGIGDRITVEPISKVATKWRFVMVGWREPDFAHGGGKNAPKPTAAAAPPVVTLMAVATNPPAYGEHSPSGKIRLGSTGRAVVELQSHLGISRVRRGKIRPDSVEKIDAFVRAHHGLGSDDGTCGPVTYRAITGHP